MSITIDQESGQLKNQSIDIDRFRNRYKTINGLFSFPSPSFEVLEKNLYFLLKNSKEIDFDPNFKMKPEYLSIQEYGTPSLWQLLMFVNGIFCKEDFSLNKVIIPSFNSIVTICQDNYNKTSDDLEEIPW